MKLRTGPIAWLIYIAVRSIFAIMQVFPLAWNLRTARVLAWSWRRILPRHYERALTHIAQSLGGETDEHARREIAIGSLESVAMFAVEVICLPRLISPFTWTRYVTLRNFDGALREFLAGTGAILVTGHYGSFELVGHLIAALGFELVSVMRPLDNVYLNDFLVRSRKANGLRLLDKKGAMRHAEDILQSGALLAFIGDQDAGRKGVFVNFFGRKASTYKSIALLAMSASVPVIVGYARRCGKRPRYEIGVQRIIRPSEWQAQNDALLWITQAFTSAIEDGVRADPSQYLWIHRRWKTPPGKKRARKAGAPGPRPATAVRC